MSFVTLLALGVTLLVAAPYLAHRLRRRRAEEIPFPPARLVDPSPPKARRRSRLEDRALFATRAFAVVLLAVLGATPLVRCSRLSLDRPGGASVAMVLVVDDSMSMRAAAGRDSRFDRAKQGARELLASAREGDAVAVVLAGAPARVALAATTDLRTASRAIDALAQSDRATDLDGALAIARGLVTSLPQVDRRIVVLSDLADGQAGGEALGEGSPVPVWVALPELRGALSDCAVLRAERSGSRVRVHIECGPGATPAGRDVVVEDASGHAIAHVAAGGGPQSDAIVVLPSGAPASGDHAEDGGPPPAAADTQGRDAAPFQARLTGSDAIASDDVAPVLPEAARGAVAVVTDPNDEAVATGGAPIVEQALSALKLDVDLRPLPSMPDRAEDLAGDLGVLLDDPAGLTPEQRHALGAFLEGGGVALLALGPRAAAAPLGATLEPVLAHAVTWSDTSASGADPATATGPLAESASSLGDLSAPRRASIAADDASAFEPLVRWTDGAPLVARRAIGRGEAWIVTLPFSVDRSDFALRPAFLALLDAWVGAARERAAPKWSEVGTSWRFPGASPRDVTVAGPAQGGRFPAAPSVDPGLGGAEGVAADEGVARFVPSLLGAYRVTVDGKTEVRVAAPASRELDLRPRAAASSTAGAGVGREQAKLDASPQIALLLLAALAAEMALRAWTRRRGNEGS